MYKTRLIIIFAALFLYINNLSAEESQVKIIFFSGNAEILNEQVEGGLPALASLLHEVREQNENVLFLHGGSAIAPSTLSSFDRGAHMIDLLNKLEPTVFSTAKSELSYKEDELTLRSQEASFPFIASNLFDPLTDSAPEGIEPFLVVETGHFKIGLISIIDPEVIQDYLPRRTKTLDAQKTITDKAALLRSLGADLVFLMTETPWAETSKLLDQGTVDIILVSDSKDLTSSTEKGLLIEHAQSDTTTVLSLSLKRSGKSFSWQYHSEITPLASYPPDLEIKNEVEYYQALLTKILDVEIGRTKTILDTQKEAVRTAENAFGNLVADSIRDFYNADVGIMNGGGIRGDRIYPAGSRLTRGDIHRELPFRNHAVHIKITGQQLWEALENGLSELENSEGCFPHVSGLTVRYASAAKPGNRLRSVLVGDKPLNRDSDYTLATPDFLANGGDGYAMLKGSEHLDKHGGNKLLWDYVENYIAKQKIISPVIEGRLQPQ